MLLTLIAILVLFLSSASVVAAPLISLKVCIHNIKKYVLELYMQKLRIMKKFISPLIAAYKDSYQWWSCFELGRRLGLLISLVVFPRNTVSVDKPVMLIMMLADHK